MYNCVRETISKMKGVLEGVWVHFGGFGGVLGGEGRKGLDPPNLFRLIGGSRDPPAKGGGTL